MMFQNARVITRTLALSILGLLVWPGNIICQTPIQINDAPAKKDRPGGGAPRDYVGADGERLSANYADSAHGVSSGDLVQLALKSNAELAAARLDLERGRARLRQAGLRPN